MTLWWVGANCKCGEAGEKLLPPSFWVGVELGSRRELERELLSHPLAVSVSVGTATDSHYQ